MVRNVVGILDVQLELALAHLQLLLQMLIVEVIYLLVLYQLQGQVACLYHQLVLE